MAIQVESMQTGVETQSRMRWYVHNYLNYNDLRCHRKHLDKFLTRSGPFTDSDMFEPGEAAIAGLERLKIL